MAIDLDRVDARYDQGLLRITFPKRQRDRAAHDHEEWPCRTRLSRPPRRNQEPAPRSGSSLRHRAAEDTEAQARRTPAQSHRKPELPTGAQPGAPAAIEIPDALPVLPLRGGTRSSFPLAVVPLTVGLPRSVQMVDDVMRGNRMLALVAQRDDETEQAGPDDLHRVGTAALIHQLHAGAGRRPSA